MGKGAATHLVHILFLRMSNEATALATSEVSRMSPFLCVQIHASAFLLFDLHGGGLAILRVLGSLVSHSGLGNFGSIKTLADRDIFHTGFVGIGDSDLHEPLNRLVVLEHHIVTLDRQPEKSLDTDGANRITGE